MTNHVEEFCRRVSRAGDDLTSVHQAIELAYESCIAAHNITKDAFLAELLTIDPDIFATTVNHLFTPINWSRVKLRTLWGVRNEATGNLLTLERDGGDEEVYYLKESSEDPSILTFAPMLTGSQEDAELFLSVLQQIPSDAPLGVGETMVNLRIDERINLDNLKAVLVKVIF